MTALFGTFHMQVSQKKNKVIIKDQVFNGKMDSNRDTLTSLQIFLQNQKYILKKMD